MVYFLSLGKQCIDIVLINLFKGIFFFPGQFSLFFDTALVI